MPSVAYLLLCNRLINPLETTPLGWGFQVVSLAAVKSFHRGLAIIFSAYIYTTLQKLLCFLTILSWPISQNSSCYGLKTKTTMLSSTKKQFGMHSMMLSINSHELGFQILVIF